MFLRGKTLVECYSAVAEVANHWMEVLYSKGRDVDDDELLELISQNKTMSQTLEDYGTAKVKTADLLRRGVLCCNIVVENKLEIKKREREMTLLFSLVNLLYLPSVYVMIYQNKHQRIVRYMPLLFRRPPG